MPRERAKVHTLRQRQYDDDLQVETSSVWGYRGECPCGWKGERRQVVATARRDLHAHLEWWHNKRGGTSRD